MTTTRLHGRDGNRDRRASAIGREVVLRFVDLDDEPKDADVPTHVAIRDGGRTAEFVETAAELGKAVLCEKPMEATIDRAKRMVEVCDDNDTTLMVAYRMHTEPAVRRAKDLISVGYVGDPVFVHGNMTYPGTGSGP